MSYPIEDIEGVVPTFGAKLAAAGIRTTEALIDAATGTIAAGKLVRQAPSEKQVADRIKQAKALPAVLTY